MLRYIEHLTIHFLKQKGWTNSQIAKCTGHRRGTMQAPLHDLIEFYHCMIVKDRSEYERYEIFVMREVFKPLRNTRVMLLKLWHCYLENTYNSLFL